MAQNYFNEEGKYVQSARSNREDPFWGNDALLRRGANHRLLRRQAGQSNGLAYNNEVINETMAVHSILDDGGLRSDRHHQQNHFMETEITNEDRQSRDHRIGSVGGAGSGIRTAGIPNAIQHSEADRVGSGRDSLSAELTRLGSAAGLVVPMPVQPVAPKAKPAKNAKRVQPVAPTRKSKKAKRLRPKSFPGHLWKPSGLTGWELYRRWPSKSVNGKRSSEQEYIGYYSQEAVEKRLHNEENKTPSNA
jgi:hypothetical protein